MGRDEMICLIGEYVQARQGDYGNSGVCATVGELGEGLLAALEAQGLVVSQGWQPIETAPRDVPILVLSDGDVGIAVLRKPDWSGTTYWSSRAYFSRGFQNTALGDAGSPTHWMPLPLPPIAAAGGG